MPEGGYDIFGGGEYQRDKKADLLNAITLTNRSCGGSQKKNLIALKDICIEDTTRASADYFNITKCDDNFTMGGNSVKFQANASVFEPGTEILVEALDVHGNPVDVEVKRALDADGKTRTVCFTVCEQTPTGPGVLTFVGTVTLRMPTSTRMSR